MSIYRFSGQSDEEKPAWKEKALEYLMKAIDFFCIWDCCWLWIKFQTSMALIVFDPFMELFITLCIVVNTLFMAMDYHNSPKELVDFLGNGNYVSITTYIFFRFK